MSSKTLQRSLAASLLVMTLGVTFAVSAANESPDAAPKKKTTDVSFDDVLVQGKYHFSDDSVTTVENDKVLDALLGVRTDFKDRLKKSAARH